MDESSFCSSKPLLLEILNHVSVEFLVNCLAQKSRQNKKPISVDSRRYYK